MSLEIIINSLQKFKEVFSEDIMITSLNGRTFSNDQYILEIEANGDKFRIYSYNQETFWEYSFAKYIKSSHWVEIYPNN
jgi:hypothetical protein